MANTILTQTGQQVQNDLDLLDNNSATSGQVLTADGNGGCAWANASGGSSSGGYSVELSRVVNMDSLYFTYANGTRTQITTDGTYQNVVAIEIQAVYPIVSGCILVINSNKQAYFGTNTISTGDYNILLSNITLNALNPNMQN